MDSSTLTAPAGTRGDRLLGRKVLVTGSSKGIGRVIAIRLAEEGADVVINYNSDPRGAEEALAEVQALGRRGAIIRPISERCLKYATSSRAVLRPWVGSTCWSTTPASKSTRRSGTSPKAISMQC